MLSGLPADFFDNKSKGKAAAAAGGLSLGYESSDDDEEDEEDTSSRVPALPPGSSAKGSVPAASGLPKG